MMKKSPLILLVLLFVLHCDTAREVNSSTAGKLLVMNELSNVTVDPVGYSEYAIQNLSSRNVYVKVSFKEFHDPRISHLFLLNSGESIICGEGQSFTPPEPVEAISKIQMSKIEDFAHPEYILYEQDTINNELWSKEYVSTEYPQRIKYTFTVTDETLCLK